MQNSTAYNNYRCNNCPMYTRGTCNALVDNGYMCDSNTGEIIDYAVRVYDDTEAKIFMCDSVVEYGIYAVVCDDDSEYHTAYAYMEDSDNRYSIPYAEAECYRCSECGSWVEFSDSLTYINGVDLCNRCIRDYSIIEGYHANEGCYSPIGHDRYNRFIGIELETDGYDSASTREQCALALANTFGNTVVFEEDCSLSTGFEAITQPMTLDVMRGFDWDMFTQTCLDYDADVNPRRAGLHIHFSRSWFGANHNDMCRSLVNMLSAYVSNWDVLAQLSKRRDSRWIESYAHMPSLMGWDADEGEIVEDEEIVEYASDTRYSAVNLTNRDTIEFRLGAGLLSSEYIRKWVDLHVDMINACVRGDRFIVNDDYTIRIVATGIDAKKAA